jgi:hypothetical protein
MILAALSILFGAALRALLAACAVWTGLQLLRVKNVRAQKAAWSVLLIAALAMPLFLLGHWFPAWAEVRAPALSWPAFFHSARVPARADAPVAAPVRDATRAQQAAPFAADADSAPVVTESGVPRQAVTGTEPVPAQPVPVAAEDTQPKANRAPIPWRTIALAIYLLAGAAFLLRWLVGLGSSIRLWLQATPVDAARECGLAGTVATRATHRISSPVNIGSGIVLPADYAEWETEKLRAVLAHERSHIRQGDFYLQLLAGLYTAFNWFSPLGWWLKHNLSESSEAISDRAALEESASPSAYAQLLLEFAALPRPTMTGVAMAHSSNLSHRIERLLDDSHFKQAFSGTRRAVVAALIVPAVLVAATALVRVQAAPLAQQATAATPAAQPADPAQAQAAPDTGQSNPPEGVEEAPGQGPNPEGVSAPPPPPPTPEGSMQEPGTPGAPQGPGAMPAPAIPPAPPIHVDVHVPSIPMNAGTYTLGDMGFGFGGGPFAIVGDPGNKPRFYGMWDVDRSAEVENARKIAHGHFLLFRRDGKSYVIDDPAIVSQAEAMDKAIQAQGEEMRNLGKQMRDLGAQQREAGQQAREAARKAREAAKDIPTPDVSKQMAELNAAVASLNAHQGGTVSREQLAELQRDVNELQRQLMGAQMKIDVDLNMNGAMAQFNEEQAKFGAEMSKLGAEMGQLSHENHQKMRELLDDSLKNGKAKPVE